MKEADRNAAGVEWQWGLEEKDCGVLMDSSPLLAPPTLSYKSVRLKDVLGFRVEVEVGNMSFLK